MSLSPQEEGQQFLKLHRDRIEEGETWAIVEARWMREWMAFTGVELEGGTQEGPEPNDKPGPIENSQIVVTTQLGGRDSHSLKPGIAETFDYYLVTKECWALLKEWYTMANPAHEMLREVIVRGITQETVVDMYPVRFRVLHMDEKTALQDPTSVQDVSRPRTSTLGDYRQSLDTEAKKSEKKSEDDDENLTLDDDETEEKFRLWLLKHQTKTEEKKEEKEDKGEEEKPKSKFLWDVADKDQLRVPLGDLVPASGFLVVMVEEKKEDGSWIREIKEKDWKDFEREQKVDAKDTVNKWLKATIRLVEETRIRVHYDGYGERWDEWIDRDSERLAEAGTKAKASTSSSYSGYSSGATSSYGGGWASGATNTEGTPEAKGAVGLRNLGNTCFMNSTLQCLSHSPALTPFFLEQKHISKLNRTNPLGWKGEVADEWGKLVNEMHSNNYTVVVPRRFKTTIGNFQPMFAGYQQQDSSELLSFLLDGLHEDLNQVLDKPATQAVESKGRADEIVAAEAWDTHLLRNQSVIVDLMQGQLKSRVTCPEEKCGRVSVTFDPFMYLSVPLPHNSDKSIKVEVLFRDETKVATVYSLSVPVGSPYGDIKEAVSALCGVPKDQMAIAELYGNRFHKFFSDEECMGRMADDFVALEVPELKGGRSADFNLIQVKNVGTYNSGKPRVIALPCDNDLTNAQVRELALGTMAQFTNADWSGDTAAADVVLLSEYGRCKNTTCAYDCEGCSLADDDEVFEVSMSLYGVRKPALSLGVKWADGAFDATKANRVETQATQTSNGGEEGGLTVYDCIRAFTKAETLSANDPWYCSQCRDFRQADKKLDLFKLPDLLIIHLKRFLYTSVIREKNDAFVDYPLEGLDLSEFCQDPSQQGQCIYDLYAVSNHMGGLGGGHYNAYAKNLHTGEWWLHDDSSASRVSESRIKSSSSYVLYYKRRNITTAV